MAMFLFFLRCVVFEEKERETDFIGREDKFDF